MKPTADIAADRSHARQAADELARLAERDRAPRRASITRRTRRRSRTPTTTLLAATQRRHRGALSGAAPRPTARPCQCRGRASSRLRQGHARPPHAVARQRLRRRRRARVRRPHPPLPRLSTDDAAVELRGRAEDRRPLGLAALRERPARAGRHPRRRHRCGEDVTANVRTIARRAEAPRRARRVPTVLEVRGEVYMRHADFAEAQRRAQRRRRARCSPTRATPPPASLRQLDAEITASPPAALLRLCLGRGQRAGRRRRTGTSCSSSRTGASRSTRSQAAAANIDEALAFHAEIAAERAALALRHRRRRLQGRTGSTCRRGWAS